MQQQPLAMLRRASFAPGTNRRGHVSGAAWSYALPSQDLASVVCLGDPSAAAVGRLALLADRLLLLPPAGAEAEWRRTVAKHAWPNVVVGHTGDASLSAPADLVWAAGSGRHLPSTEAARWRRLLRQGRLVYRERRSATLLPHSTTTRQSIQGSLSLRLTPLFGEPRSAIPAADELTARHFRASGLEEDQLSRELRRRGIPYAWQVARALRLGSISSRPFTRLGLMSGDLADASTPPHYLRTIAAAGGVDLEGHRWGLSAKGLYPSQKALFFLYRRDDPQPDIVVKMSQDPSRSHLLKNAYAGLVRLEGTDFGAAGRSPRPRFTGTARGLRLVGEEVVAGAPFVRRSLGDPACPYAADAVAALIELGRITVDRCPSAQMAVILAGFLEQFLAHHSPSAETSQHLRAQLEKLAVNEVSVPLVFMHGDPGLQNLVIRPDGRLALLDWENAEPAGVPLWDLFEFLRTFVVWAGRRRTLSSRLAAVRAHYLEGAALTDFIIGSVERYRRSLEIERSMVAPLFWTQLLVQAVREAPRLDASQLQQGHQFKLLELFVAQRHSAVLGRILQIES